MAIRGSEWGRGSGIGWNEMDWQTQRCSNRTQHSVRCCHYCWCCCCCSRLEKLLTCSIWVRIQFDFHRARTKKLPTFWKFAANSAESQPNREKTVPMTVKMLVHLPFTWMPHIAWPNSLSLFCFVLSFGFWLAAKIFEIFCFRLAKFAAANGVLQRSGMQASEIHQRIIKFAVTYGVLASPRLPKECAVATEKK